MSGTILKKLVRLRMAETGEKYTTALRAIEASPEEFVRLKDLYFKQRAERRAAVSPEEEE